MLSLKIALRFLTSNKLQTAFIILGISVAISVQIFVGLLIESLQISLVDSTMGNAPHITITSSRDDITIRRWEQLTAQLDRYNVVKAISASANGNAYAKKGSTIKPVLIRGFDFDSADRIYHISEGLYNGRINKSRNEILMGKDLAQDLELKPGDSVTISAPDGSNTTLKVTGFFDLGISSINKTWVVANRDVAQDMFGYGSRVTSIDITTNNLFYADVIANLFKIMLNDNDIRIENWKQLNQSLLRGLEGQRISSAMIQVVIIISVAIAIASILAITVLQKSRQIGILKAMGIKNRDVALIFLYQGFLLGIVGAIVGVGLALGLLQSFISFTTSDSGVPVVDVYIDYFLIIRSWIIAVLSATIAGLVPARNSLKLNPVDVIREG
ncbi:MAG: ABC transporter permease [Chloroflexota bacterium]|nr:MAG: ABC transporter permease [Chloroflexota bacterium]